MGYSIAVWCKSKEAKDKMYSFMLKNYKEPKNLFNVKNNYSRFTDDLSYEHNKFALGFDYSAGIIERYYIYCVCCWMAINVGKRKRVGNKRIPYYVYDGCEKTLLILVRNVNIDTENYVKKQVSFRFECPELGVDIVDRLGFFRIEDRNREAMEKLIERSVDEVDNLVKNELIRLNDLWKEA